MSAIWGMIDFHNQTELENTTRIFADCYKNYKIDHISNMHFGNVAFGCGIQYLTVEAHNEVLPYFDEANEVLFTADCILDNREELLQQFSEYSAETGDSTLLYAAYRKWGTELGDHVLGAFTLAVYEHKLQKTYLFTDHMSNRSLFYYFKDGRFYFSTLLVPLASVCKANVNEKWLASCLLSVSADMMLFPKLTPFAGIIQQQAGCYLEITEHGIREQNYWSPLKLRETIHLSNQEEYRSLFVNTLSTCVVSALRSNGLTGCTLSGGLDSSSIACTAAPNLQRNGQALLSYTSIPLPDFPGAEDNYSIADESPYVRAICNMYPNIVPHFVSCPEKDAFTELPRLIPLLGYPMKSGHNLTWLNEIYETAASDGCKLMLKGQFGNSTISYGPALGTIYCQLSRLQLRKARQVMNGFCRRYHVPRKKLVQLLCKEYLSKLAPVNIPTEGILTNPKLTQKYKLIKVMKKTYKKSGGGQMDSRKQRLSFLFDPLSLMQLGMFDTAMGLIHGLLIRDPCKDKRIVELCCKLPAECNLAGYLERGMVRTYMQGIVPDCILNDIHHRGLQSADYSYRSRLLWHLHAEKILKSLSYPALSHYVNQTHMDTLMEELKNTSAENLTEQTLRRSNVLYSSSLFLQEWSTNNAIHADGNKPTSQP